MLPFMTPRIEPVGYLGPGGDAVDVSGPINWDLTGSPGEMAVWFTAVVSQVVDPGAAAPIAVGLGASQAMNTPHDHVPHGYPPTWWLTAAVLPGNAARFVEGGATVSAWATIVGADGGASSYFWGLPIKVLPKADKPGDWPW